MISKGTITLMIQNVTFEETERYRRVIKVLFLSGALNIKNGDVTLSFDNGGELKVVKAAYNLYRGDKQPPTLDELYKGATIEVFNTTQPQTQTKSEVLH